MSEAETAAQVASWENKSLRADLQGLQERSVELSSALELAGEREAAAKKSAGDEARAKLEHLYEAVRAAEAAKAKAEDGLALAKDKKKRDLQVGQVPGFFPSYLGVFFSLLHRYMCMYMIIFFFNSVGAWG